MALTLNHDCSRSWSVSVRFVENALLRKRWQAILLSLPYAILVIVFAWDLLSTGANEKRVRPTQVLYAAWPDWMSSSQNLASSDVLSKGAHLRTLWEPLRHESVDTSVWLSLATSIWKASSAGSFGDSRPA